MSDSDTSASIDTSSSSNYIPDDRDFSTDDDKHTQGVGMSPRAGTSSTITSSTITSSSEAPLCAEIQTSHEVAIPLSKEIPTTIMYNEERKISRMEVGACT